MNAKNIAIIAVALVGLAAVALIALPKLRGGETEGADKPKPKPVSVVELDEFLVNLADTGEQHYLKAVVVLEIEGESPAGEGEEKALSPETARIRDAIITTMSRRHFGELLTESGKTGLKKSIRKAVNEVLGEDSVRRVNFTSFAMQ